MREIERDRMSNLSLKFDRLPVWRGLQNIPGVLDAFPFSLSISSSGLIQQNTEESVLQKIHQAYSDSKYNFITSPPGLSLWGTRLGNDYIEYVESRVKNFKNSDILEIGAGTTYFAKYFLNERKVKNYTVVDPAISDQEISTVLQEVSTGLSVFKDYFTSEIFTKKFSSILSNNCLEHVHDPIRFMQDIKKVSQKDTDIILVFPDNEDQFLRGDLNAFLHEHISYFTKKSAENIFNNLGFDVLDSRSKLDCLYFHLRVSGEHTHKQTSSGVEILFSKLKERTSDVINRFDLILKNNQNKKIALHGACNGLNNLLYFSKTNNFDRINIFDGDEMKKGKYLPTCQNAIRHSEDPTYSEYDLVYIAAATFYDEIKKFLVQKHGIEENKIHAIF